MRYDFLIIGDSHIPDREANFSPILTEQLKEIKEKLPYKRFDKILFTGDFTDSNSLYDTILSMVNGVKDDILIVIGNMDGFYRSVGKINNLNRKREIQFTLTCGNQNLSFILIHGHQIRPRGDHGKLYSHAKKKKAQIIISGHTHADDISILNNMVLHINPGSCTGAWSFLATGTPSFADLSIETLENAQNAQELQFLCTLYILKSEKTKEIIKKKYRFKYDGLNFYSI